MLYASHNFPHSGRIGAGLPTLQIGKLRHRKTSPSQFHAAKREEMWRGVLYQFSTKPFLWSRGKQGWLPVPPPSPGGRPCDGLSWWTSERVTSGLKSHSWRWLRLRWPGRHCWFSPRAPSHQWLPSPVTCNVWCKQPRPVTNVREWPFLAVALVTQPTFSLSPEWGKECFA